MSDQAGTTQGGFWTDATGERTVDRYSTLVNMVDDGIYQLDAEGRFVAVNDAIVSLTGYAREELLGKHASTVIDDEDVSRIQREIYQRFTDGDREGEPLEFTARMADGETIPCELELHLLVEDGTFQGTIGVVRDIADRKQTEQEFREHELELFRTLLNHSNDSVLVVDPETGRYLDVNDTACERRGYSREEFLDLTVMDLETEIPDQEAWRSFVEELRAEGQLTFDGHHRRKDGTTYPVEVNTSYVDLDKEYVLAIARDVTKRREYERYLEDAKSQLEAATEAGAVGTWEWHIPEDEMVVGTSFARTFGIEPEVASEGVPLDQFIEAIHEDDRKRVEVAIEEAVETCGDYEEEYRVWDADDNLRWVVARGHVECDDGEPVRFPGALTDITKRKRAELKLQQNNEQLETLFEVLPVGVVVAEADGQIIQANDIAHEIWGGDVFDAESVEEYEQYPVWDAESGERVQPDEMTLARVVNGEEVLDPDIYEIEAVDGERRVIRLEGMPVRDEHGEVTRGVATLTDITDRREAQRALEESERRYRTLVENFPNGAVGLFDDNLRYTAVGGQLFDRLDYDPEDRIGYRFTELHTPDLVEELEPHFRAALDGEASTFEIEYQGRYLHAHTLPVRDADDEVYAGMLVIRDVTERREYERMLEESNDRLEQFAYAASHDLQEPLRMVSSYLQLLERRYDDDLDEDGQEFLEFAVDGADRMREMIDGLLKYSRVETRGDPFETVSLDDVLTEVCDDLQVMIQESNAEITTEDLPRVEGDHGQLRQVFQNLLDNAIEYSGDDPPRIYIDAERDGDQWLVSVEDNGVGIDPEDTDRVFEVFQRLHARGEHAGTGIGLALVERIIERHGGDVWVESDPGQGSTFSFTLPVASDFET
ncbi:PAS/PAC sensor signal transduction histidine kinase (plasmid) [Haloterrigena turkmenica DSM 5511]|uniref:histidine kinase n=1 Tax=Haloterrigena turkmenica (strain ATCC 51198 / DSM 5511 / JCM 9101 / NCIMB 13204 / VKM B-1734 / 4k) TaxID=543526 RepID=D2S0J2_HALTV|nr:PAS domain S-box protein [Haloterrigena turkmenica]ADB62889.1 PAS/PAC sensor signal transduction histidine kinase [Haloterrigena turkmenica DSM 5511]